MIDAIKAGSLDQFKPIIHVTFHEGEVPRLWKQGLEGRGTQRARDRPQALLGLVMVTKLVDLGKNKSRESGNLNALFNVTVVHTINGIA